MKLKQVTGVFFSPTDSTRQVVELAAGELHKNTSFVDITEAREHRPSYYFMENEAVVVGVPVYGGRVPVTAAERIKRLHGRSTPAILIAVYGNRAYEDALLELGDLLRSQGFVPVGALAVAAEHNMVPQIASGRPDAADQKRIVEAAGRMKLKLQKLGGINGQEELKVPGNRPYRTYQKRPVGIKVSRDCNQCGMCIKKCPVQAISRTDPRVTDEARCLLCMRCIRMCPVQARKLPLAYRLAAGRMLKKACSGRKETETFL